MILFVINGTAVQIGSCANLICCMVMCVQCVEAAGCYCCSKLFISNCGSNVIPCCCYNMVKPV